MIGSMTECAEIVRSNSGRDDQVILRIPARAALALSLHGTEILCWPRGARDGLLQWRRLEGIDENEFDPTNKPFQLFSPSSSESTLHFDPQRRRWIAVWLKPFQDSIQSCISSSSFIESEWQCAPVAPVPSRWRNMNLLISYAGRAHPFLVAPPRNRPQSSSQENSHAGNASERHQMVLSFVPNAHNDIKDLYEEGFFQIYTPKFLLA